MIFTVKIIENQSRLLEESFTRNLDSLKEFLESENDEITVSVENADYIDRYTGKTYVYDESYGNDIVLMLKDLKKENSCLYKLLLPLFPELNTIEGKIKATKYMLEKYMSCIFGDYGHDHDNFSRYASYYFGPYYFKYDIPKQLEDTIRIDESTDIDLSKLNTDQLFEYVIPLFYRDLSWWDREEVRNDPEKMEILSNSFLDNIKIGELD